MKFLVTSTSGSIRALTGSDESLSEVEFDTLDDLVAWFKTVEASGDEEVVLRRPFPRCESADQDVLMLEIYDCYRE